MVRYLPLVVLILSTIALAGKKPEPSASVNSGIERGDIVTSVNGIKLDDPQKGARAMKDLNGSNRAVIRVIRNGKEQTLIREGK